MNATIKARMKANEAAVLKHVRKHGVVGVMHCPVSNSWRNAINRLADKGKLTYSKNVCGYVRGANK